MHQLLRGAFQTKVAVASFPGDPDTDSLRPRAFPGSYFSEVKPEVSPRFSLDSIPISGEPSGSVIGEHLKYLPLPPGRHPVLEKHCGVSTDSFLRPEMFVEGAELPPVSTEHCGAQLLLGARCPPRDASL